MTINDMVPLLETDRLILRAHRLDDFDDSAAMWADPAVVRHISGTPSTRAASWTRLLRYAGFWTFLGFGYWAVEAKADGRFVREVGFGDFKRPMTPSLNGCPEAGWVLKSAEHGQGFATEAVSAMIGWADRCLDVPATVAIFDPLHNASISVARKIGYQRDRIADFAGQPTLVMRRPRTMARP